MATFDKRKTKGGRTTWRARVRVNGQSRAHSFDRLTDAKTWASQVETDLKLNRFVPSSEHARRTLDDVINRYTTETLLIDINTDDPERTHAKASVRALALLTEKYTRYQNRLEEKLDEAN